MAEDKNIRPTKKQRELLGFIESFIKENGYSPSYREIMNGLGYTSVATVALHVNNLIKRGHLRKRDRSARSLEIVGINVNVISRADTILEHEAKWLVNQVHSILEELEAATNPTSKRLDDAYVLVGSLHVLGLDDAVRSFVPRLGELKTKSK